MPEPLMTIGQVAERARLRTSRIRFYERVGVLPEPERVGGQRRYRTEVLQRLSAIDVAQRAGLSLDEIAPLTGDPAAEPGPHLRALAGGKLAEIDALIARAEAARGWLQAAQACKCVTVDTCGLFADPFGSAPAA
jgi:DNA-binding transcriptional MerR regulator